MSPQLATGFKLKHSWKRGFCVVTFKHPSKVPRYHWYGTFLETSIRPHSWYIPIFKWFAKYGNSQYGSLLWTIKYCRNGNSKCSLLKVWYSNILIYYVFGGSSYVLSRCHDFIGISWPSSTETTELTLAKDSGDQPPWHKAVIDILFPMVGWWT